MEIETCCKDKIYNSVMNIIEHGGEAVVRKRSKNGEKYIEVAEQRFNSVKKYTFPKRKE